VHTLVNNEVGNMRLLWALRDRRRTLTWSSSDRSASTRSAASRSPRATSSPRTAGATRDARVPFPREADDIYHVSKINDTNYCALACRKWGLRITDVMQCTAFGASTRATEGAPELDTRLDYDAVFGTVVNRFAAQIASAAADDLRQRAPAHGADGAGRRDRVAGGAWPIAASGARRAPGDQ
jgi:UDP-sulfoquinovose synthase